MTTDHPDEGTIHAWLDGALGAVDAARIEAHVAGCPTCSAAVAEARGLIAGASRVVRSLDAGVAPVATVPAWGATRTTARTSPRGLRVTPARAAIAATLVVALGVTLVRDRSARARGVAPVMDSSARMVAMVPRAASPIAQGAVQGAPEAGASLPTSGTRPPAAPQRTLERAPGPDIAIPTAPESPAKVDTTAPYRVAEGRAADLARRDTAVVVPDGLRTSLASRSPTAMAAPMGKVAAGAPARGESAAAEHAAAATAPQCVRVEGATPDARWGALPLPATVALQGEGASGRALVLGALPADAEDLALTWARGVGDTVRLTLRGPAYAGTVVVAPRTTAPASGTVAEADADASPRTTTTTTRKMSRSARRVAPATSMPGSAIAARVVECTPAVAP